jgi:hypothetical protein
VPGTEDQEAAVTQEQSINPPTLPPPGWFPDPWDGRRIRWWSGVDWSDRTEASPGSQSARLPIVVVDGRPIPLSGWWRRAGGLIIDDLIVGTFLYLLWVGLGYAMYSHPNGLVSLAMPRSPRQVRGSPSSSPPS